MNLFDLYIILKMNYEWLFWLLQTYTIHSGNPINIVQLLFDRCEVTPPETKSDGNETLQTSLVRSGKRKWRQKNF